MNSLWGDIPFTHRDFPLDWQRVSYSKSSWAEVENDWDSLFAAPEISYFRSRRWCTAWLEVYGERLGTEILTALHEERLGAACLLNRKTETVLGAIPIRRAYLNTAGEGEGDGVSAEYNGILFHPDLQKDNLQHLAQFISELEIDEFIANGLTQSSLEFLQQHLPEWSAQIAWSEDPYIDLASIRNREATYRQAALSKNTRGQVNRTLNAYGKRGEVGIEIASSVERALEMLSELKTLHQATWVSRGQNGAFASDKFCRFHELLIRSCFECGSIMMSRVTVGDQSIGLLYSFVDSGRILFYQSGFRYEDDNRFRPGLATHVTAIEECIDRGYSEYHFLAGDDLTPRYKQSLSTDVEMLAWARFIRPSPKNALLGWLRSLKQNLPGKSRP